MYALCTCDRRQVNSNKLQKAELSINNVKHETGASWEYWQNVGCKSTHYVPSHSPCPRPTWPRPTRGSWDCGLVPSRWPPAASGLQTAGCPSPPLWSRIPGQNKTEQYVKPHLGEVGQIPCSEYPIICSYVTSLTSCSLL